MDKLRLIKIFTALLTFLLVFGLLAFMTLLFQKTKTPKISDREITLNEPDGSHIDSFEVRDNLLYLSIKDGGLSDRVVIFDTNRSQVLTKIRLNRGSDGR